MTRLIVLTAALLLPAAGPLSAAVDQAVVTPNRGAAGVKLGMTRTQVVARIGQPLAENQNGVMTYATGNRIFDVYRNGKSGRVRMLVISGRNYCTPAGICALRAGAVGKLQARYGSRLVPHVNGDGLECYFLEGRFGGRRVFTSFIVSGTAPSARILDFLILHGRPEEC
jgi:hypothetical protein